MLGQVKFYIKICIYLEILIPVMKTIIATNVMYVQVMAGLNVMSAMEQVMMSMEISAIIATAMVT